MLENFLLIRQSSSVWAEDSDEEEEKLCLDKFDSFDIEDDFESKIPPLSKTNTNFKSENIEIVTSHEDFSPPRFHPLKLTKTFR